MFSLSQHTLETSDMTTDTIVSGGARMQAKKMVFTFLFCNSAIFLIVLPPASSYVSKNPQEQSTEQRYSWESSSSFVRSFHTEQIRKLSCVMYRSTLLELFIFQQEKREKRHEA